MDGMRADRLRFVPTAATEDDEPAGADAAAPARAAGPRDGGRSVTAGGRDAEGAK
jgi:hypothetical protein